MKGYTKLDKQRIGVMNQQMEECGKLIGIYVPERRNLGLNFTAKLTNGEQ